MINRNYHDPPPNWIGYETAHSIGDDHYVMWAYSAADALDPDGENVTAETARGLMEWHWDQISERWCGGFVGFRDRGIGDDRHQLVSTDPLTIAPSLLCYACPSHGFIHNGRWRPA